MSFLKLILESNKTPKDDILVMRDGKPVEWKTEYDTGFYYCPYIPVIKTTAMVTVMTA